MLIFSAVAGLVWLSAFVLARYGYRREWLKHPLQRDVNAIGTLGLASLGFFWRLLFVGDVWIPRGVGRTALLYPLYSLASRSLRAGHFPLWNPYLNAGEPFLADQSIGLLYPLNLAFFLLVPRFTYRTLELMAALHIFLAGASMYLCLRFLEVPNIRRLAALAGALAFMFSGFFVAGLGDLPMIATVAWLPLVFLCHYRALHTGSWRWTVAGGLLLGVAGLAGSWQMLLYIALLLFLYLIYSAYDAYREEPRKLPRLVGQTLLIWVVALGLAAPALLPGLELSRLSTRAALSYSEASIGALSPEQLVGMLVPGVFGQGADGGGGPSGVGSGYIGIFPLMLALITIVFRRDRLTRFLMGVGILSLFLMLGGKAIAHGLLYLACGGTELVLAPARFVLLLDFALVALAARGLNLLLEPLRARQRDILWRIMAILAGGLALFVLIALPLGYVLMLSEAMPEPAPLAQAMEGVAFFIVVAGFGVALLCARRYRWMRRESIGFLSVVLIFLDLASLGRYGELEGHNPAKGYECPGMVEFLRQDQSHFRLSVRPDGQAACPPGTGLLYELPEVLAEPGTALLADFQRLRGELSGNPSRLYALLNLKYLIAPQGESPFLGGFTLAYAGDPVVDVYRYADSLPRAFLVPRADGVESQQAALEAIQRPDFDPRVSAVMEGELPLSAEPDPGSKAEMAHYGPDRVEVRTSARSESLLVTGEVFYPGWKVVVDGRKEKLLRVNYLFRGVRLPAGGHRVEFLFDPPLWKAGLGLSLATLFALLALGTALLFRKRSPSAFLPSYFEWWR